MKLKPCKCGGKPKVDITKKIGLMSGDEGYSITINCPKCDAKVIQWALRKSWVKESAYKAWNVEVSHECTNALKTFM